MKGLGKRVGVGMIRFYQVTTKWMPASCRFTPSCSNYTLQAIQKYGLLKGSWMGAKRILRCNPFNPGGHDPVP
ncbi:MAG: membrane protein insertion efficiency factor YidD [Fimbriimonadales bacterium]